MLVTRASRPACAVSMRPAAWSSALTGGGRHGPGRDEESTRFETSGKGNAHRKAGAPASAALNVRANSSRRDGSASLIAQATKSLPCQTAT